MKLDPGIYNLGLRWDTAQTNEPDATGSRWIATVLYETQYEATMGCPWDSAPSIPESHTLSQQGFHRHLTLGDNDGLSHGSGFGGLIK